MDKQNEKEKKMAPPKEVPNKKNLVINSVKRHLMMKISIPVFVILIFLSLFVIKSPYTAKERYTALEPYTVEVTKVVVDKEHPIQVRVCQNEALPMEIVVFERPYGKTIMNSSDGSTGYRCYGSFKLVNKGDSDGVWIVRYLFNISNSLIQTEALTQKIPKYTSWTFRFETTDCQEGDKIDGSYQIVESPQTESCKYVLQDNRTMVVNETKYREDPNNYRIITKYESLWQKLTGYNRYEKI
jgi:hypothetical protein